VEAGAGGEDVMKDKLIREAMEVLLNCPSGGVGLNGPTLKEMDSHSKSTGQPWEDDASYDTCQRAWRLLKRALSSP